MKGDIKRACMQNSMVAFLQANDEDVTHPTRACTNS